MNVCWITQNNKQALNFTDYCTKLYSNLIALVMHSIGMVDDIINSSMIESPPKIQ